MPYIILNDAVTPWAYYTGHGFLIGAHTSENEDHAQRFDTLSAATTWGPLHKRPDLRALGWRVVPVSER